MRRRLLFIFAAAFFFAGVSRAADVDESHDAMTSVHAREMITAGDARVIPTLLEWLPHGLADDPSGSYALRVNAAIVGVGAFNLVDQGPTLVLLYRSQHADGERRLVIAMAVSQMRSPAAATFLRQMVADRQLHHAGRCLAAIALVRSQADEAARDFVVQEFQKQMVALSTGDGWDGLFMGDLGTLHDPPLMERIKALEPDQSDPRAKSSIESTLSRMELRHESAEALIALADSPDRKTWWRRDEAIRALGDIATPGMIARIEALQVHPPVNASGVPIAERMFAQQKAFAIGRIRQRAYATQADSATQP